MSETSLTILSLPSGFSNIINDDIIDGTAKGTHPPQDMSWTCKQKI
jgi:hypothetical protein